MITAMLLTLAVNGFGGDAPITCVFPSESPEQKVIRIALEPRPSLKDQPGLYRVMMDFDGEVSVRASAQPIWSTDEDDILIRGRLQMVSLYSLGLRADGLAAFNVQSLGDGKQVDNRTRIGECRGHEAYVDRWLSS